MSNVERTTPIPRRFRFRFSLRQLFVAVGLVAVVFGIWSWIARSIVRIRTATPNDSVSGDENLKSRRNAAVVSCHLRKRTAFSATLWLVRSGIIEAYVKPTNYSAPISCLSVDGDPLWETNEVRLALGDTIVPTGSATKLYFADAPPGYDMPFGPSTRAVQHNINIVAQRTLPCRITPSRLHIVDVPAAPGRRAGRSFTPSSIPPRIVYVEGDQKINVDGKMTIEEFAKQNPGNYLVVTVTLTTYPTYP